MIKVLVTGADGQLGLSLQNQKSKDERINFIFTSSNKLDITNKSQVFSFFAKGEFDYCINCAAYTAVDKAEIEIEKAYLVNAQAVRNLAEACKEYSTVLIHVSTDFVFDGQKKTPYTEDDNPNPIGVYGASKLKGEQYIQEVLDRYFIVRTSWVYSEYGNNFVKTMLRLSTERSEINVVDDQMGSPTYAGDLAEFLLDLTEKPVYDYGIYHFSNEGVISWFEFAIKIFLLTNKKVKVNRISTCDYPTLAERPAYSGLNKSKVSKYKRIQVKDWDVSLKNMCKRNIKCLDE